MTGKTSCRGCIWLFTQEMQLLVDVGLVGKRYAPATLLHCAMDAHPGLPADMQGAWPRPRRRTNVQLDHWALTRTTRCDKHTVQQPGQVMPRVLHEENRWGNTTPRQAQQAMLERADPVPMMIRKYLAQPAREVKEWRTEPVKRASP